MIVEMMNPLKSQKLIKDKLSLEARDILVFKNVLSRCTSKRTATGSVSAKVCTCQPA